MQITPTIIFGLAMFACVLTRLPDKYKPAWARRLNSWQTLIGLVAVVAAILIIMNPEFYALGLLGDSAFFDLLVLAIGLQLQNIFVRLCRYLASGFSEVMRFAKWRFYATCSILLLTLDGTISAIQKAMHRMIS
jgi:hypothetical protein